MKIHKKIKIKLKSMDYIEVTKVKEVNRMQNRNNRTKVKHTQNITYVGVQYFLVELLQQYQHNFGITLYQDVSDDAPSLTAIK